LVELLRALEAVEGKKPKKPGSSWLVPDFKPPSQQTPAAAKPKPEVKLEPIPEKKAAVEKKKIVDPVLEEKIRYLDNPVYPIYPIYSFYPLNPVYSFPT
jgi:hypothetical protein